MNILLNNYCNLKCNYCFANKVLDEDKKEISLTDMKYVLEFIKNSNMNEIRLLGGEPTLHPKFTDIILQCMSKPFINHLHIFTNGIYSDKINFLLFLVSLHKQVSLLVNLNSPSVIGYESFNKIINNIKKLQESKVRISLGINFYAAQQDYEYIINTAKDLGINKIRWSIVVPNTKEKSNTDVREYFKSFESTINSFISQCALNDLKPHVDCNNMPICLLEDSTLRKIAMIGEENLRTSVCSPVIDVKPNLKAIRCFAMSGTELDIKDFSTVDELKDEFVELVDKRYEDVLLFPKCKSCITYKINKKSCGCISYKKSIKEKCSATKIVHLQSNEKENTSLEIKTKEEDNTIFNLDKKEFAEFIKFNNVKEKQARHIDTFNIGSPNMTKEEIIKKNTDMLISDSLEQIKNYYNNTDEYNKYTEEV